MKDPQQERPSWITPLRLLIDRISTALENGMRREPVATAVAIGLVTAGATSTFSGFLVGVVAAVLLARTASKPRRARRRMAESSAL